MESDRDLLDFAEKIGINFNEYKDQTVIDLSSYDDNGLLVDDDLKIEDCVKDNEEDSIFVNMSNIYLVYFKKLFNKKESYKLFEDIKDEDDENTNRCMELLYEDMLKFNSSDVQDKDLLYYPDDEDLNIDLCEELYTLQIDNKPVFSCKFLLPLVRYLAEKEWTSINWLIVPIKTNSDKTF